MAIVRMINTREPGALREFQTRMVTFGRIRAGVFETPPGKRGRPVKLDRFRFTSSHQDLIEVIAEEYGGVAETFQPQGSGPAGWQVTTDADRIPVYIVNGQKIDPTYEAWSAGRRCIRRCDGEWNTANPALPEPCVCNGLHPTERPPAPRDMCKMTTRVSLMLPVIEGIGSWLYESHGENFAIENGGVLAQFVASAPVAVPAWFCLEPETRQYRKPEGGFEKRDFFVARLRVTSITPEQAALGADAVTRILTQAGAPAVLSGNRTLALSAEAAMPVSSVPVSAQIVEPAPPAAGLDPDLRATIVADIKAQTDGDGLDRIREKLSKRGIDDQQVKDAWNEKARAIRAAAVAKLGELAETDPEGFADAVDGLPAGERVKLRESLREVGPCLNPHCAGTDAPCGATPDEHMRAHGVAAIIEADYAAGRVPTGGEREHQVGDVVEVGGIEFVKVAEHPFDTEDPWTGEPLIAQPGTVGGQLLAQAEAAVDVVLPMVPDDDYDADELYAALMTGASKQTPPLTTAEVNGLIAGFFQVDRVADVAPIDLARLRAGLKSGVVGWR